MNNYYMYWLLFALGAYFQTALCSDRPRPLSLVQSCMVGAFTGAAEVVFPGQVLAYRMNQAIKKEPFVLAHSYRGFTANVLGGMSIVGAQKIVETKAAHIVELVQGDKLSRNQNNAIFYMAGVVGALIDTPCNAAQLSLQESSNVGSNLAKEARKLGSKSLRGFAPNAFIKEGPFVVAYQTFVGPAEACAAQYIDNPSAVKVVGGLGAGVFTAVITQPGAVLCNTMQGDLFKPNGGKLYRTAQQTALDIIKQDGARGLFCGLTQRGVRIAIAVPLYAAYSTALESHMKK